MKDILNELPNLQLNLELIFKLYDTDKSFIFSIYKDMLHELRMSGNVLDMNMMKISSIYNTLRNNNYLITNRERNIDELI